VDGMAFTIDPSSMLQYFVDLTTSMLPVVIPYLAIFLAVAFIGGLIGYLRSKAGS